MRELTTIEAFDEALAEGVGLTELAVRGLDLRARHLVDMSLTGVAFVACDLDDAVFVRCPMRGVFFLGCTLRKAFFAETSLTQTAFLPWEGAPSVLSERRLWAVSSSSSSMISRLMPVSK